ncbi:hypothetical protein GLYMA_02G089650v4 [Glycine max]|nr:hypothetical protein GLYMA_02G089650v4 [Glycine max]KAH1059446.1 hypothetical protein GYH30_003461 [Glycine max]
MLMSKACEIFIQELTFRAWMHAEKNNKSIVQPCDVAKVIMQTDTMNFLTEIIPNNLGDFSVFDAKEENIANIAEENEVSLSFTAGFMGNPMMKMDSEENAGNIVEGNQATLPYTSGFMGNPMNMMNMDNEYNANGSQVALPYTAGFMGNPMMNMGNEENAINIAEGSQVALPYNADFVGNLMNMMQMGTEDNAGNLANGSQDALPCTAGFMGNPMMNMGSEENVRNIAEGSQASMPYTTGFMGNLMNMMQMDNEDYAGSQVALPYPGFMKNSAMNMVSEENVGNITEESQVVLPYTDGFMENHIDMMNMSYDLEAGNQLIPQPNMMQPPFMPSDQLPYNFQPN